MEDFAREAAFFGNGKHPSVRLKLGRTLSGPVKNEALLWRTHTPVRASSRGRFLLANQQFKPPTPPPPGRPVPVKGTSPALSYFSDVFAGCELPFSLRNPSRCVGQSWSFSCTPARRTTPVSGSLPAPDPKQVQP
ncbi:conserved hypothetical protein [Coccidioides posadasii str. Silveira]|uniref:Uncharacterized protein n=2 Tax=Coccidioides posadasii TaxID=199306 RepID=E9CYY4_COCPS|nr:conserved hypothetical protein [Coccidioides posadasii str. Silveira]KMM73005.1 hypothetical protein CPAG_09295 [Coccidioides posadasii RMSCC 3488]